jgi:COP9 signalosome complex subunit 4
LAAWKYFGISNQEEVVPEAKLAALRNAILCAILSPAGDTKYKLLSVLSKDERSKSLSPHSELLEKLYLGHIIKKGDTEEVESSLQDHQAVRGQDGYTVLQRCMLEHNIIILSKLYLNISFQALGKFLDIDPNKAEAIICDMA